MEKIEIREAKREDCKAIRSLIQELADFEKMPEGPKIDHERLEQDGFDSEQPMFMCHVAVLNEVLIGYAIYYYTYSTWFGKAMYMEDLYVTSKYRKQHIGTKLLQAVAKKAVDNNCCRLDFAVLKWNHPACSFYKRMGALDITEQEKLHRYTISDAQLKQLAIV